MAAEARLAHAAGAGWNAGRHRARRFAGLVLALCLADASAQTSSIPPPSHSGARPAQPPAGVSGSTLIGVGTDKLGGAIERRGESLVRRGAELAEEAADHAGILPTDRIHLDLLTPPGKGLKLLGRATGAVGTVVDLYSIGNNFVDATRAGQRGDLAQADAHVGEALATANCMHPFLAVPCLVSELTSPLTGVDPVKWALREAGTRQAHEMRIGCSYGGSDPYAEAMAQSSPECSKAMDEEARAAAEQRRAARERELSRVAAQNATEAQARLDAQNAYRATLSTPAEPTQPSQTQLLLESFRQGLAQQRQSMLRAEPAERTAPKVCAVDPKTGCHPGHDEGSHPGGCKCGR